MHSILLVDDHEMIRDAIKQYLNGHTYYSITAEASNGQTAFKELMNNSFDLVITDVHMPYSGGLELIENIRLNFPDQKVLALTMDNDPKIIRKLNALNIDGYVLKNIGQKEFVIALEHIFNNTKYYSLEIRKKLSEIEEQQLLDNDSNELSPIEKKVLDLITEQAPKDAIIRNLNIEPLTLQLLIKSLYRKTNCTSEQGLILYAIENGLI